jgi:ribosomal protein L11 methylase PrmA
MAAVSKQDTVYDLGCGDGRIVITAAQRYGARGVGIDIDPERVAEATDNVRKAGVADRVKIVQGDLFEADISAATVVTLYLLTDLNLKLRPKLLRDLKPGTRVVSHAFSMGDWKPVRTEEISGTTVYLWRIPPRKA